MENQVKICQNGVLCQNKILAEFSPGHKGASSVGFGGQAVLVLACPDPSLHPTAPRWHGPSAAAWEKGTAPQ